jgi:hypothetical protein
MPNRPLIVYSWARIKRGDTAVLEPHDEKMLEQLLERQFQAGTVDRLSAIKILEAFRSARAQQKASAYALYAAIAAGISAIVAVVSVAVSIFALMSKSSP